MRKIFFLFLLSVFLIPKQLFSYEVNIVKLSDEQFEALTGDINLFLTYRGLLSDNIYYFEDKQIATVTLIFNVNEIGQDFDAVIELAKKEAKKLGADRVYYVSGNEYKNTEEIAATTFRFTRSKYIDEYEKSQKQLEDTKKMREELENTSDFFKKLSKEIDSLFVTVTEDMETHWKALNVRYQKIKLKEKNVYKEQLIDLKTGKELSEEQFNERWGKYFVKRIIAFYKNNLESYKSEYGKIDAILKKYPNNTMYFPKVDSNGNINYGEMEKELLDKFFKNE